MDASTDLAHAHPTHHDEHAHDHHHELGFWRKYIFSTDHKVIGIQYGISGLIFLFFGFSLMMLMRWQLAFPGKALPFLGPIIGNIFGAGSMPDGKMAPDFYNSLGAMHGTIMIFLGIVPVAFAAFGNFVVPLQIGAPDMTFPKINMASYQAFFVGGIIMLISFFVPGGAAKGGWTSY
ncbi:MAG: cbb3-type cytochrome c oxidase subunit I, partial [Verrucomicrobiota bacterium]|nr:cbb3-type cytochrome c oxidase subunit I [Verrucomicrobiota bacterium]